MVVASTYIVFVPGERSRQLVVSHRLSTYWHVGNVQKEVGGEQHARRECKKKVRSVRMNICRSEGATMTYPASWRVSRPPDIDEKVSTFVLEFSFLKALSNSRNTDAQAYNKARLCAGVEYERHTDALPSPRYAISSQVQPVSP